MPVGFPEVAVAVLASAVRAVLSASIGRLPLEIASVARISAEISACIGVGCVEFCPARVPSGGICSHSTSTSSRNLLTFCKCRFTEF
jgi:hypothetical protein